MDQVINAAGALLAATLIAISLKLWAWITEKIKASQQARLGVAAERSAGQVVQALDSAKATASAIATGNAQRADIEISAATDRLMETMGETITSLGGSREQIENVVRGELGKLLVKAVTK